MHTPSQKPTHMHTCVHTSTHTHSCPHAHSALTLTPLTHTLTPLTRAHSYAHSCPSHAHSYVHIHTHTHTRRNLPSCTHSHVHTCAHTQKFVLVHTHDTLIGVDTVPLTQPRTGSHSPNTHLDADSHARQAPPPVPAPVPTSPSPYPVSNPNPRDPSGEHLKGHALPLFWGCPPCIHGVWSPQGPSRALGASGPPPTALSRQAVPRCPQLHG